MHSNNLRLVLGLGLAKQSTCIARYYRDTTGNIVERTAYIWG